MVASLDNVKTLVQPQSFDCLLPIAKAKTVLLETIRPVAPDYRPTETAIGFALAADLNASHPEPEARIAMQDGYAVSSRETIGATPSAPVYVSTPLSVVWAGDVLEDGCDAVLPPHAITAGLSGMEILQAVAPASGAREPGHDLAAEAVIARAGERLRADRAALLEMTGITEVAVRVPRFEVEGHGPVRSMIEALVEAEGAAAAKAAEADVTVILTKQGHAATAVAARKVAEHGTLLAYGLAVEPGQAMGFGTRPRADGGSRIVFIVSERLEEVMAAWFLLIKPSLAALAGREQVQPAEALPLTRKIVSGPGLAQLVLLRRTAAPAGWEPLATGDLPWWAFAAADAYALIPAESEGMAAGALLSAASL